jgi:asparagine synthase (glutamine-hydrolysing)
MCGIAGVVAPGRPAEVETAAAMAAALDHRGPDGDGLWSGDGVALGFRRLAIIDLSDAGMQPMASTDGRDVLVHNGEIYNYRELRAELEAKGHDFRSASDTEVILAAYREWGVRCVERFNGMWAFAIWDGTRRMLFASRDRFGVKPFYYRHADGRLVFASELKAFRADPAVRLEPNARAIRDYLEQGYLDHTDETFFAEIVKLPPAHCLTLGSEGLRTWRYWALEPRAAPAGDAAGELRELFLDAVRLRLRSDVPVGTCLSGGIDSSAVACAVDHLLRTEAENARPVGPRQRTFTAYFAEPGFDEREYAEAVVERTRAEPHWITFGDGELVDVLDSIVEAQDEPFGSTSIVAQWFVMREARRAGLKVLLDGQGADETLAGYHSYFGPRFADLLAAGRLRELRAELGGYRRLHGAGARAAAVALARPFVPERVRWLARGRVRGGSALVGAGLRGLDPTPEGDGAPYRDRFRRQLHLILTRRGLPELLHYEDRNSMAHSLEARVPFLDYRLVELLFSLEGGELIERGRTKAVLRRALGDLLPPVVRDRVDKLGFVTPEHRWLRGRLGELAADVFASRSSAERGWVDATAVRRRLERHRRGELDAGFELWRALNLELWARTFLDASPPSAGGRPRMRAARRST